MLRDPFALFRPFQSRVSVAIFSKQDDLPDDAAAATALGVENAAGLWQMHGNKTVIIRSASKRTEQADGMITGTTGLALCTRWADCQNFVIYEPEKHVCGVLHAGWKGLIAGAIPEFFRVLENEFGIEAPHTFVGAGPSLCQRCADFTDPARELPSIGKEFVDGRCVDLRRAADAQLKELGVRADRFERHPDCTRCTPRTYWTYRGGDREAVKESHTNILACALRPV